MLLFALLVFIRLSLEPMSKEFGKCGDPAAPADKCRTIEWWNG